ncbi:hypothetical protein HOLleu_04022 [Holothuria leucospilota]|uniref:Uncharacterized protein n=1 Tax=Holothuria leucospilota TaxID=206669 RepID=A0A9Q1HLM6_HOLLE|nr:hypothetical protein HOLleu_04022 [Holothuria leucospilota]
MLTSVEGESVKDIRMSPLGTIPSTPTPVHGTSLELDGFVSLYDATVRKLLDKHAPVQTKLITVRPEIQWMNDNVKESKRSRRKAKTLMEEMHTS